MTLIKDSLVKSLTSGLDNFAIAIHSLESLYIPTVVTYTWGLLIKVSNTTAPVDPDINEGLVE